MKLAKLIFVLLVALSFTLGGTHYTFAQTKTTMKIATVWSTDDASPNKALNYLKVRIEQLTKGQVTVELHKGTLGGERDLFEGVMLGTIQAGAITTGTLGSFIPLAEIFMVPYIFKDWDHAWACTDGYLGNHMKELALKQNMRIMEWWAIGGRQLYGNGKPVATPKDLKGRKIRVMETPFLVELYKHYGAIPTPMAYPEVYTGLQQGVIDGAQAGLQSASVHHHEVVKWVSLIDENYTITPFVVSEKWWSKLSPEIKESINQALLEATRVNRVLDLMDEDTMVKKVWAPKGVKIIKGDREAFRTVARELYPRYGQLLKGDSEWLKWIDDVGVAFPIDQYAPIKKYGGHYKF